MNHQIASPPLNFYQLLLPKKHLKIFFFVSGVVNYGIQSERHKITIESDWSFHPINAVDLKLSATHYEKPFPVSCHLTRLVYLFFLWGTLIRSKFKIKCLKFVLQILLPPWHVLLLMISYQFWILVIFIIQYLALYIYIYIYIYI